METETPTISPNAAPCFYAQDANGYGFEVGDGVPHWQTASEGWRELRRLRVSYPDAVLKLAREDHPCWLIACAGEGCGYAFDEDVWVTHWPSRDDAAQTAQDSDWTVEGDRAYCPDCQHDCGFCGTCTG